MERLDEAVIKIALWLSDKPTWLVCTLALAFAILDFLAIMYITLKLF
jgi:hypothetical protein